MWRGRILVEQYASQTTTTANPNANTWLTTAGTNGYKFCSANDASSALPSYFDCSKVRVSATAYAPGGTFAAAAAAIDRNFNNASGTNFAQMAQSATTLDLGKPGYIVVFQAFYPMPIYLSVLLASGSQGNQATNLYGQSSGSVGSNPTGGSALVHYIYSVMVFRNEPQ